MKLPLSWLKEYVDIEIPIEELAHAITMAGLEVEEIHYVGLPLPDTSAGGPVQTKTSGIAWDPEKIVVGSILEVMPHPNADRLVLCRLDDGEQIHTVLTGAPNLFPYKGAGPLDKPIKVAYAREGAQIYDGHQPGQVLTTLKRAKIRGVESYSMACSEKELGISDEHEGIIFLDDDAQAGTPLAEYIGDAVLDIAITPNIARNANVLGIAREVAAILDVPFKAHEYEPKAEGPSIEGLASLEILDPELNPRFVLGCIRDVEIKPSPYRVQLRLRLSGVRPINNIVDATNYAMLEVGEPLHAFDYDVLVRRAGGKAPKIITRLAKPGERLVTLDDVDRALDDFTVVVTDTAGSLALAGVMGGQESEVSENTRTVLLEGAAWNFINTRRTVFSQKLPSEAAYRFSRGVHPAMASRGVKCGLELMRRWSDGVVYQGLIDNYPLPPKDPTVTVTPQDVLRWLGIELTPQQIGELLGRLEFDIRIQGEFVHATTPDHRLDIGEGIVGMADLMEEIARIYGYEKIPETRMADELPPQFGNPALEKEEKVRDLLVGMGLQEIITYRMTHPDREARRLAPGTPPIDRPYVPIANPVAGDRSVLRQSLISSALEVIERNSRLRERIAVFEIAPVFLHAEDGVLPEEITRLVITLTGPRAPRAWQGSDTQPMDFYDLKGILDALFSGLHLPPSSYQPVDYPSFHPGKSARVLIGEQQAGVIGELHPQVRERFELPETPLLVADLNLDAILNSIPARYNIVPVPAYPSVLEDLAVVVDEDLPADQVEAQIRAGGGTILTDLHLFDVYRGEQVGSGKKSLAYSLTYQDPERTLTDKEVARVRNRIIRRLQDTLGAGIRSA